MRLYQRTLGSFITVILIEGALSGVFIATILGGMQSEDAARELKAEAASIYKSFNAWKLSLWKIANELPESPELLDAIGRQGAERNQALGQALRRALGSSGAELCMLRLGGDPRDQIFISLTPEAKTPPPPDPGALAYDRGHPFIDMLAGPSGFWFVGATKAQAESASAEIFILKAIDPELLGQLGSSPRVQSLICAGGRAVSSSAENPAWVTAYLAFLEKNLDENAYSFHAKSPGFDGMGSSVIMSSGSYSDSGSRGTLYVSVILSLASYRARLARINAAVAVVSLIVAGLSLALSLGLARIVAKPVRDLLAAMRRLRSGETGVAVPRSNVPELESLLAGFNDMARNLDADKADIGAYIDQIVKLKEYNEDVIDSIREGLAVVDSEGVVEKANAAFSALISPSGAVGKKLVDLSPELFDPAIGGAISADLSIAQRRLGSRTFEVKSSWLDGGQGPARRICIVEDVSERIGYEERMMQAEKLSSIGLLSAGIAHEVNNPLDSILSNVQNMIAEEGDPGKAKILGIIEAETKRIARIVHELLAFAAPHNRQGIGQEEDYCDPGAVAAEIATMVGYSFRNDGRIDLRTDLQPCPAVAISRDGLKQILLNLLSNAIQAIGDSGAISLSLSVQEEGARIRVEDSGKGISQDVLPRICDPFFTTRADEGGMGLGLSVVYGLVTKRGGRIHAENREEGGARLDVFLPLVGDWVGG